MKVEYIANPTQEIEGVIFAGLDRYEKEKSVKLGYEKYAFVVRDNNGEIIAGLIGYTAFEEVYVDDLWVKSDCRGNGYGKLLLDKVWSQFKDKGYDNINLCTNGFQAPEFYKKCGLELEFVREKKNKNFTKYFFIKRF